MGFPVNAEFFQEPGYQQLFKRIFIGGAADAESMQCCWNWESKFEEEAEKSVKKCIQVL